jgi:hypothetical protein
MIGSPDDWTLDNPMANPPDESTGDAQDEAENNTPPKLTYPDLHCPHCNYCLTGLTEPICPECGQTFSPGWLYSSEYRFGWRWTRTRVAMVSSACLIMLAAIGWILIDTPDWARGCLAITCAIVLLPAPLFMLFGYLADR